jgi:hypothetical protein
MINNTIINVTTPIKVFTSSSTGAPLGGAVTGQTSAITTIILCNTLTPNLSDETVNSAVVDIYLVSPSKGGTVGQGTLVVSKLTVPAGETVFFSEERIVLDSGDEIHVASNISNAITVTVSSLPV